MVFKLLSLPAIYKGKIQVWQQLFTGPDHAADASEPQAPSSIYATISSLALVAAEVVRCSHMVFSEISGAACTAQPCIENYYWVGFSLRSSVAGKKSIAVAVKKCILTWNYTNKWQGPWCSSYLRLFLLVACHFFKFLYWIQSDGHVWVKYDDDGAYFSIVPVYLSHWKLLAMHHPPLNPIPGIFSGFFREVPDFPQKVPDFSGENLLANSSGNTGYILAFADVGSVKCQKCSPALFNNITTCWQETNTQFDDVIFHSNSNSGTQAFWPSVESKTSSQRLLVYSCSHTWFTCPGIVVTSDQPWLMHFRDASESMQCLQHCFGLRTNQI